MMAGFYCCLRGTSGDYIMATGLPDVRQASEAEEFNEECSGKKKSKFKTFKNFFAKKKRKDPTAPRGESGLKPSQSSSNVSIPEPFAALPDSETGSQSSIANRAVSHDSIFIPELSISETAPVRVTSQENMPGRVKALQLQLQQNIRLVSPSVPISTKKSDDAGTISEDDGLPRSPPEISSLHAVLRCSTPKSAAPVERHSSLSLGGTESEDEEQISSRPSSRPLSPLSPLVLMTTSSDSLPVDFSSPASPLACLDSSAARHKIAVHPRRHKLFAKQSKPTIREHSGSPKMPKFVLHERKGERDRVTPSANNLLNENGNEIDPLTQGNNLNNDVHHNKVTFPQFPETNGEESEEKVSKSSKILEASHSHSPVPEGIVDGNTTVQSGDILPYSTIQVKFDSEKVITSEDVLESEKTPNIQGLPPEMLLMHEDIASPSFTTPRAVTASAESSETDRATDGTESNENATLENAEENLFPSSADKPPSQESISVALHTKENEEENVPNAIQAKQSSTSKQAKGVSSVATSHEALPSPKEKEGGEENLTDQSKAGEIDVESLLNYGAEYTPAPCNDLTDNIGFTSEVPLEDSVIQPDPCAPHLLCGQGQTELSISDGSLQDDHRPVNQGPVKFSIASAWQRSILETSGKNEALDADLTQRKPEHCGNLSEGNVTETLSHRDTGSSMKYQQSLNQPLKMKSDEREPASTDGSCLQSVGKEQTQTGLNTKGSPFGVKLRRTSPLYKYSTGSNFEQQVAARQEPMGMRQCIATQTLVPEGGGAGARGPVQAAFMSWPEKDNGKNAAKLLPKGLKDGDLPPGNADAMEFATQEKYCVAREKNERRKSENQLDFGKTSERNSQPAKLADSTSAGVRSSEPVWVSLARQKQKGFQGQHSGTQERPQPLEDKFLAQIDTRKEATKHLREKAGKKNPSPSFQSKEMNINVKKEDESKLRTAPALGPHLQPKPPACGMAIREKSPMSNVKVAPLAVAEPPWLAIAKKKAKAWSDMPQTVQ
uniref:CRACD-like protein n=1 Tax=Pristiophorus japonicus TaxID=55135 RepID=UPI00398E423A